MSGMVLQGLGIDAPTLITTSVNVIVPGKIITNQVNATIQPPVQGVLVEILLTAQVIL